MLIRAGTRQNDSPVWRPNRRFSLSPLANLQIRLSRLTLPVLATILTFAGIFAMAARPSIDTDTWWHLRAGAWMVAHHQVLAVDMFSSTRFGQPWLNHSWLSQILLYGVWQLLSYAGLNLLTAVLVVIAWWFVYARIEGNAYLKAFCLVLGAAASAVYWSARPQMASFLLTAVFAWVLGDFRWRGIDLLWWLPLLVVLWVNLHGGFAIGFLLLLGTLAGQGLSLVLGQSGPGTLTWSGLRRLAVVSAICAAVVPLNPFGPALYLVPLRTVSIGVLQQFIQEWQSPDFHLLQFQPFIGLVLATIVALGLSRRRADLTDLLLVCGFTYLALVSARNVSNAALIITPLLARHAAAIVAELHQSRPRLAALVDPAPALRNYPVLNGALLGLVLLAVLIKAADASLPATNAKFIASQEPVKAVDYLEQAQPPGPLFNAYNWGGYLAWRLYPNYPVFVDGRTDLYDDALLRQYLTAALGQPSYRLVLDQYGVNLVLVEQGSPLAQRLAVDTAWRPLYADSVSAVFQRVARAGLAPRARS